ncbi:hypothetical protein A2165_03205 [Candidatus Curtissbacteria bacterium RBG_13_40_7]|uniref:Uncharacterized protein n=1 Tax=Candidatus Curtissbacteria bacterium RBG_13_40_7 TaxID=1797706 RepID=A0A1F5FYT0_9BACT|nr:MAG: hypothetical protein A2165_03205 [Candidatus Curtissbacteria bacterium RBG_13_40_7]
MGKFEICACSLLAVALFLGGVALIISHIPFWSEFLGVPATLFGFGFIILTFDELNQLTLEDEVERRPFLKPSWNPSFFATRTSKSSVTPKKSIRKRIKKKATFG